ncbi:conserved hypothetical protein [Neospora caninum Liverpool]|uniref:Uncharacterized protein n=1 Tax=Neospora caninum (strain Liverpool) TaxID=572307 RepID=F0VG74_NEOCL|nr:conserved hypothetical protein [Neospora caninum Liverpool]CBZ52718.1 conserved hypothetical protein [Neospora caninum Liverpool]|eukprot:XP_003882750.1 conserved hypothetical protein [Neospora caninum Liverpool]
MTCPATQLVWRKTPRALSLLKLLRRNPDLSLSSSPPSLSSSSPPSLPCSSSWSPPSSSSSFSLSSPLSSSSCVSSCSYLSSSSSSSSFSPSSPSSSASSSSCFSSVSVFHTALRGVTPFLHDATTGHFPRLFRTRSASTDASVLAKPSVYSCAEAEKGGEDKAPGNQTEGSARDSDADSLSATEDAEYQRAADALLKTLFQQVEEDAWEGIEDIDYRRRRLLRLLGAVFVRLSDVLAFGAIWPDSRRGALG